MIYQELQASGLVPFSARKWRRTPESGWTGCVLRHRHSHPILEGTRKGTVVPGCETPVPFTPWLTTLLLLKNWLSVPGIASFRWSGTVQHWASSYSWLTRLWSSHSLISERIFLDRGDRGLASNFLPFLKMSFWCLSLSPLPSSPTPSLLSSLSLVLILLTDF